MNLLVFKVFTGHKAFIIKKKKNSQETHGNWEKTAEIRSLRRKQR